MKSGGSTAALTSIAIRFTTQPYQGVYLKVLGTSKCKA